MTTAITTTAGDVAASPVLGQQPDRGPGLVDVAADPDAPTVETLEEEAGEPAPQVLRYRDGDGRVHYASPYSKATRTRVTAGDWTEIAAEEPDAVDPFDPTEHLVRDVLGYLEEHAADEGEVQRVKDAEALGDNRPTIRDWAPDSES